MNKSQKSKIIGLVILIALIAITAGYAKYREKLPDEVHVNGLIGSEKQGLFDDPEFQRIVKKNYGITYEYTKSGSFDQVLLPADQLEKYDYLFPSNQLALEVFKSKHHTSTKNDIVFNTPIVLYTRKVVADALIDEGVASKSGDVYTVDMKKMAQLILEGKTWAEIGVDELYGNILIDTTNPNRSNSGNMFLGLLANAINDGTVVDASTVGDVKPKIREIYNNLGYMQVNSGDLFKQFLKQGVGAFPIIAGYENQILEFSKENPDIFKTVKDDIVIMYPTPTVWSSHVFIALDEDGAKALEGLIDRDVQNIAWKHHGFRTGVSGATNIADFEVKGLKDTIVNVIPMPNVDIMNQLMSEIQ